MKFRIGDKVKYISDKWNEGENNPLWGGKFGERIGKVTLFREHSSTPISVNWKYNEDYNYFNTNVYRENDLELLCNEERNCKTCKYRLKCLTIGA